ncbi:MAG: phosphatidate cytidylyltransferase [Chloroflexi bacterium]|nr:phosphatidate cytidylyltransferase [Chloroflexota bacterium]
MPDTSSARRNLVIRIITGVVAIPLLAVVIWAGLPWVTVVAAIVAAIAATEVCIMAAKRGEHPSVLVAVVWAWGLVIAGHFSALDVPAYLTVLPAIVAGLVFAFIGALIQKASDAASSIASTTLAACYSGGLLLFVPLLREAPDGTEGLYLLFIGVFATDILAYSVGRLIGRHRMAPSISPGKTWEGVVGGLAGGIGAMIAATAVFGMGIVVWQAVVLGIVVAAVAMVGDLFESKLKRIAGVKDSGWLVPGHGGLLDRLDSILFNIPVLYLFMLWVAP